MAQEVRCPQCGAFYKGNIPDWVTSVQCSYCKTAILIDRRDKTTPQVTKVVYVEEVPQKSFSLAGFSEFMRKKGYSVDPVSGLLRMGPAVVCVSEGGNVEGPEPYRTRTEKWIADYMKT